MPNVFSDAGGVLLRQKNSSGGMIHAATQRWARTRATILRIMKTLSCMLALLLISNVSVAQDASASRSLSYVPSLGDMMTAVQLRHSKLWYAVKAKNWSLADYELRQLDTNLKEGKRLHPNIPGWDIAGSDKVAVVIGEALKAKNEAKFDQAFTQLTTGCNACHRAADRAFIYIRRPTFPSPFSNQVFAPRRE